MWCLNQTCSTTLHYYQSQDSSISIVTRLHTEDQGLIPSRVRNSSLCLHVQTTQPPVQWVLGALSPGVKWLRHEIVLSPPSSTEVKNVWSYTSTPPYVLIEHKDTSSWYSAQLSIETVLPLHSLLLFFSVKFHSRDKTTCTTSHILQTDTICG